MNNRNEIERANCLADAIARYAFIGSVHPSEQAEIIKRARLAASALLQMQGIPNPTEKEIDLVLAGL